MRIWLDSNLTPQIAAWVWIEFDVVAESVIDLKLHGLKVRELFQRARDQGVDVITKDSNFAELVTRHGIPPQVVLLTCGNTSNAALRDLLKSRFARALSHLRVGEPLIEIGIAP